MSYVKDLLVEKNVLLEKFMDLNQAELVNFSEDNFDNLENFYHSRDCILEMIRKIDQKIGDLNRGHLTPEELSVQDKADILHLMDRKNEVVQLILAQDLQILSRIESEKSNIIKDLKKTQLGRKAIGSYKADIKEPKHVDESA